MRIRWMTAVALAASFALPALGADNLDPKLRSAAEQAIGRGVQFLQTHQGADGSFSKSPGITGLAVRGILEAPPAAAAAGKAASQRGLDYLVKHERADGAITEGKDFAGYNTSLAMGALAAAKDAKYRAALDKGQAFLKKHQADEGENIQPSNRDYGGIGYGDDEPRPDMSNTFIALQALRSSSLDPKDPVWEKARKFISRSQNRTESNNQKGWVGNNGGFVYMPGENMAPFPGTQSYGGITAAGLVSLLLTGLDKSDARVKAAYDFIRHNYTLETNPGTQLKDGIYYYYYAYAQAMNAMGEPLVVDGKGVKHNWRNELVEKLLSLQTADGSWVNKDSPRYMQGDPVLVTGWTLNALNWALR